MDSPIEEIKGRVDIIELVSQYIKLRKTGANYSALCPFHSEKSGSFFVSPARQMWKCFGCGKHGDIFTFVQEIEGVEFGDALRILAAKAGVELKRPTREAVELKTERQRLYEACELAAKFYEKQLEGSLAGREAKKYLLGRALSLESIASWRIGWAPASWQGLHDFLAAEGFVDSEIISAGLAAASAGGRVYDRFRGRIMFPISDFNSQVVGFGGRIFESEDGGPAKNGPGEPFGVKPASAQGYGLAKEPKYLNTSNTLLYDKSRILYGLDRAKVDIRKQNACILVEGYTDVIMSTQAGVKNVVASSGTALTPFQLAVVKRFTDNLVLGYDMDLAGDTANARGIELALAAGFNVSVARPPYEDKDPADVIAADPEDWRKAVAGAKTIMEFYFERAFSGRDAAAPRGKKEIAALLLPPIKRIANAIEQSFWLQKLAGRLGAREEDLRLELKKVKLNEYNANTPAGKGGQIGVQVKPWNERLENRLLVLTVKFPKTAGLIDEAARDFFSGPARQIIDGVKTVENYSGQGLDAEGREYYDLIFLEAERDGTDERAAAEEVGFHVSRVKKNLFKDSLARVSSRLLEAEKNGDAENARRLREEFNHLSKSAAAEDAAA